MGGVVISWYPYNYTKMIGREGGTRAMNTKPRIEMATTGPSQLYAVMST